MKYARTLSYVAILMAACSPPTETVEQPVTQSQFAIIKSLDDCQPYQSLLALEERYLGLYLGELHGSMNAPQIIECFILTNADRKRTLIISLEMSHDARSRHSAQIIAAGAKGLGTGTPPIRKLITHYETLSPSVQFHYHDGYYLSYTYATDTSQQSGPFRIEGAPAIEGNQRETWNPIPNARERSIGDAIKREIQENRFIVALGGNIHASRATWSEDWGEEGRAGSYLPKSIATVLLRASQGGALRFCTDRPPSEGPSCDLYDISPRPDELPIEQALISGARHQYDYAFDVGTWRPIPAPPDNPP